MKRDETRLQKKEGRKQPTAFSFCFSFTVGAAPRVFVGAFSVFLPASLSPFYSHTFFVLTHISLSYRKRARSVIRFVGIPSFSVAFRKLRVDTFSGEKKKI